MKIVAQEKKISRKKAEEYIMLIAKYGDNIMNSDKKFIKVKDWEIKEIIFSRKCDYRKVIERCRYPYQDIIPFIHNLITAGGLWQVSGGSLSITNPYTGESEELLSEDGVASLNSYATLYEQAHSSLLKISEEQKYVELINLVTFGVASVEAFLGSLVETYNKSNVDKPLVDNKLHKVSFEDKIDKWLPIIIPGSRFNKDTEMWKDFIYIQKIRDGDVIHQKSIRISFATTEIVQILNSFKNGISGFLIKLHEMKNDLLIPTTIIRDFYTPSFYSKEIKDSEIQNEPYYKTLKPIFEECCIPDENNPFFLIKDVERKLENETFETTELIEKTKRALLIFPDYILAYEILVILYSRQNDYNNIIKYSKLILKIDSNNEIALYYSGMVGYHSKSYADAVIYLLKICEESKHFNAETLKQINEAIDKSFEELLKTPYWGDKNHSYSEKFSDILDKVEKKNKKKIILLLNTIDDLYTISGMEFDKCILIQSSNICSENEIELLLISYLTNPIYEDFFKIYPNTGKLSELVVGRINSLFELKNYQKLVENYNLDDTKFISFADFVRKMGNEQGVLIKDIQRVFILLFLSVTNEEFYTENLEKIRSKYSFTLRIVNSLIPFAKEIINPALSSRKRRDSIIKFLRTLTTSFSDSSDCDLSRLIMVKPIFCSNELNDDADSIIVFEKEMLINKELGVKLSGIKLKKDNQVIQSGIWDDNEIGIIRNLLDSCNLDDFLNKLGISYYLES